MATLGEPRASLVIRVNDRLRQPDPRQCAGFLRHRQRAISHQPVEASDILGGFRPPRHPVHYGPPAHHRILEGPQREAIAVDHLRRDAKLDKVVDQGVACPRLVVQRLS